MQDDGIAGKPKKLVFPSFKSAPPPVPLASPVVASAPKPIKTLSNHQKSSLKRRPTDVRDRGGEEEDKVFFDIDRRGDFEIFRYGRFQGETPDYQRHNSSVIAENGKEDAINHNKVKERIDWRAAEGFPTVFVGPSSKKPQAFPTEFIRLPSSSDDEDDETLNKSVVADPLIVKQKELNALIAKDPTNETAWIELVRLQPRLSGSTATSTSAVLEKQAMILEKAMSHLPDSIALLRIRLSEVEAELKPFEAVFEMWKAAAASTIFNKKVSFWEAFVDWMMSPPLLASFQIEAVLAVLAEAMDSVDYTTDPTVFKLFERAVTFLHGAGFEEKAVAILRGFFDFNFGPPFDHASYPISLNTKTLDYVYCCSNNEEEEGDLLEGTWLELERKQMKVFWCPRGLNPSPLDPEEDFNRDVVFEDISSFIYWTPHADASAFFKLVFSIFGISERPHEDITWRLSKLVDLPAFMLPKQSYPQLSPSKAEFILSMLIPVLPAVDDFDLAEIAFSLYAQYRGDWRERLRALLVAHPGKPALFWAWCRLCGDGEDAVRTWRVLVESFKERKLQIRFAYGAAQMLLRKGDLVALKELLGAINFDEDDAELREISAYLCNGTVSPEKSPFALALYQIHLFLHPEVPLDLPTYRSALLKHLQLAPNDPSLLRALSKLDPIQSFNSALVRWINEHESPSSLKLLLDLSILQQGNVNRVRGLFERVLSISNDPALWIQYLDHLHSHDTPSAVQAILYRAIQRAPGSKALYMTGIELVPGAREELYALAEEKGIRLRCLLEEATR